MTRLTSPYRTVKPRSEAEMRKALNLLCDKAWGKRVECFHIPPDDQDADIVLSDVIGELIMARREIEKLNAYINTWIKQQ